MQPVNSYLADAQEAQCQSQGHSDLDKLFFTKHKPSRIKLADFIGPVQVKALPGMHMLSEMVCPAAAPCTVPPLRHCVCSGKGRCVVAAKDIQAGDLLAVCNPLAIAYVDDDDIGFQMDWSIKCMVKAFWPAVLHTCA